MIDAAGIAKYNKAISICAGDIFSSVAAHLWATKPNRKTKKITLSSLELAFTFAVLNRVAGKVIYATL
jgi:hypothetical protein